ncbi:MAG: glycosyltransferase, partial [Desulfovibrionaceae bacterium]|nr:glycosyltransferase [Desulfovibrionaceae bacterium]
EPEALAALCAALNAEPKAGLCGSTMRYAHAPDVVQCSGGGWLNRWLGTTRLASDGLRLTCLPQENARPLDFVLGASCLIRREVFERCGLLPEEYFLYYEEVDFALRARRQGFGCLWARASHVLHKEGASTKARGSGARAVSRPAWVDWLMVRNRLYLMRRHFPLRLPVAVLGLPAVCVNRLRRGQAGRIPGLLLAAWRGLCGKMGRPAEGVR